MGSPLQLPPLLRWLAWAGCGTAITIVLLIPISPSISSEGPLGSSYSFTANLVHIVAYGVWTALTALLPVARRTRWLLSLLLLGHGAASELLQGFVPTRYPDWEDVGWDLLGIVLGVAASWPWWRRE
ncbi:MAG: VanZ family protein [Gemmataceae bacterium]